VRKGEKKEDKKIFKSNKERKKRKQVTKSSQNKD
jgi:hypothetical protein